MSLQNTKVVVELDKNVVCSWSFEFKFYYEIRSIEYIIIIPIESLQWIEVIMRVARGDERTYNSNAQS